MSDGSLSKITQTQNVQNDSSVFWGSKPKGLREPNVNQRVNQVKRSDFTKFSDFKLFRPTGSDFDKVLMIFAASKY